MAGPLTVRSETSGVCEIVAALMEFFEGSTLDGAKPTASGSAAAPSTRMFRSMLMMAASERNGNQKAAWGVSLP